MLLTSFIRIPTIVDFGRTARRENSDQTMPLGDLGTGPTVDVLLQTVFPKLNALAMEFSVFLHSKYVVDI